MPLLNPKGLGLSDAVDGYFQAHDAAVQRQKNEDLRGLGVDLSNKVASGQPIDYKTLGAAMFRSGDFASGLAMLKLGQAQDTDKSFVNGIPGMTPAPAGSPSPVFAPGPKAPSFTMPRGAGVSMTNPDDDVDTMARTIAAEAGNQGDQGMAAVAHVIANRAKIAGLSPTQVIERPHQFEAYDNGSADRYDPGNPAYDKARQIAQGVLSGQIPDPTNGATHYLNPDLQAQLGRAQPSWAPGNGTRIGAHVFYSLPQDAAALYGRSAPLQAAQGQVASNDPGILPPPSAGMQRVQDEAKARGIGQTEPAPAASSTSLTPYARYLIRGATSGAVSDGMRETAKMLLKEELERSRPNVEVKDYQGRLMLVDKNTQRVSDVTPKGLPEWRGATPEERASFRVSEDQGLAIGPDSKPMILGGGNKDADKTRILNDALDNWKKYKLPNPDDPSNAPFWRDYSTKITGGAPQVNIDQKTESSRDAKIGAALGEVVGEDIKAGSTASQRRRTLGILNNANEAGGDDVTSGPLAPTILKGKQAFSQLTGIDLAGVPESEAVQKVNFELATQAVKAISSRPTQMEFGKALENLPGLSMSKVGRKAMLSILSQQAQQDADIGKLAAKKENWDNWNEIKDRYYEEHPLISPFTGKPFGDQDIQVLAKAAPQGTPPAAAPAAAPAPPAGQNGASVNGYVIRRIN